MKWGSVLGVGLVLGKSLIRDASCEDIEVVVLT